MFQLQGPEWLPEHHVTEIFGLSRWQLTRWTNGLLRHRETILGVREYRRTDVEQLANIPGRPGTLARKQLARRSTMSGHSAGQRRRPLGAEERSRPWSESAGSDTDAPAARRRTEPYGSRLPTTAGTAAAGEVRPFHHQHETDTETMTA